MKRVKVAVCGDGTTARSRAIGEAITRLGGLGTADHPLVVTPNNVNDLAMAMYGCIPPFIPQYEEVQS